MVRVAGIEPAIPKASDFKSDVYTNSTTLARRRGHHSTDSQAVEGAPGAPRLPRPAPVRATLRPK